MLVENSFLKESEDIWFDIDFQGTVHSVYFKHEFYIERIQICTFILGLLDKNTV